MFYNNYYYYYIYLLRVTGLLKGYSGFSVYHGVLTVIVNILVLCVFAHECILQSLRLTIFFELPSMQVVRALSLARIIFSQKTTILQQIIRENINFDYFPALNQVTNPLFK